MGLNKWGSFSLLEEGLRYMRIKTVSSYTPTSGIILSVFNIHVKEPSVLQAVKFFPLLCLHSNLGMYSCYHLLELSSLNALACWIISSNVFLSDLNFYPTHSTFPIALFCFNLVLVLLLWLFKSQFLIFSQIALFRLHFPYF